MANCERCGCFMRDDTALSRAKRGKGMWGCQECRAGQMSRVRTAYGVCTPHHGDFDEHDRPLQKNGELFRAGHRLCGHSDCVDLDHIRASEEANA